MNVEVVHRLAASGSWGSAMISTWPGSPPRLVSEDADASVNLGDCKRARRKSEWTWGHQTRGADSIDLAP